MSELAYYEEPHYIGKRTRKDVYFKTYQDSWNSFKNSCKSCLNDIEATALFNYYKPSNPTYSDNIDSIYGVNKNDYDLQNIKEYFKSVRKYDLKMDIYDTLKFKQCIKINVPFYYLTGEPQSCLKIDTQKLQKPVNVTIFKEVSKSGIQIPDLRFDEVLYSLRETMNDPHTCTPYEGDSSSETDIYGNLILTNWSPDYHTELYERRDPSNGKTYYKREISVCPTIYKKSSQLRLKKDEYDSGLDWTSEIIIAADQSLSPRNWYDVINNIQKKVHKNNQSLEKFRERCVRLELPKDCFIAHDKKHMNISKDTFHFNYLQVNNKLFQSMLRTEHSSYREIVFNYIKTLI